MTRASTKLKKPLKNVWSILKETISNWQKDQAARLAAALACYTLLSIAPLVVLSVAVAGLLFGREAAQGEISQQISSVVGPQAGSAIEAIVVNAKEPSSGIAGTTVGIAALLFGASGVFGELQSAMNTIWEVEPKPNRGVGGMIRDRFFSFAMVLGVAFLLMVSLVLSAALAAIGRFFEQWLPGGEPLWQVLNVVISLGITILLFLLIFKFVPDVEIAWRDVWIGAAITAILFTIGKIALGIYIGKSSVTSAYGAAGSLVALVLWVYYSTQVLFLGAEFTQVYAARYGSRIVPSENAVPAADAEPKAGTPKAESRAISKTEPARAPRSHRTRTT